jgi:hypothetical protein
MVFCTAASNSTSNHPFSTPDDNVDKPSDFQASQ